MRDDIELFFEITNYHMAMIACEVCMKVFKLDSCRQVNCPSQSEVLTF